MIATLDAMGLPEVIAILLVVALNAYVLTGGADFGGGAWDLLASGPRRDEQRALISHEIAPIWEANHVWLILAVVILFTGFPPAFATLGIVLHIPLSLVLIGIVLRGSSFVFRSYGANDDATQRRWGRVFAVASLLTPLLLGAIAGAIATGAVGAAAASLPERPAASAPPAFADVYLSPWLAPFPLAMGVLALAMFVFLAAVYLAYAARDAALRDDFRRRALAASALMFVAAFGGLTLARHDAPALARALIAGPALMLQAAIAVAAALALIALWQRRWSLARVAAAVQVSLILWGWVVAQYPLLIPPSQSASAVASPRATLVLLLGALVAGGAVLLPALAWLFRLFARRVSDRAWRP